MTEWGHMPLNITRRESMEPYAIDNHGQGRTWRHMPLTITAKEGSYGNERGGRFASGIKVLACSKESSGFIGEKQPKQVPSRM